MAGGGRRRAIGMGPNRQPQGQWGPVRRGRGPAAAGRGGQRGRGGAQAGRGGQRGRGGAQAGRGQAGHGGGAGPGEGALVVLPAIQQPPEIEVPPDLLLAAAENQELQDSYMDLRECYRLLREYAGHITAYLALEANVHDVESFRREGVDQFAERVQAAVQNAQAITIDIAAAHGPPFPVPDDIREFFPEND